MFSKEVIKKFFHGGGCLLVYDILTANANRNVIVDVQLLFQKSYIQEI